MNAQRKVVFAVVTAGLVAAGTVAAQAEWAIPVSASVKARAATMPQGVTPSVEKDGKAAVVSWSTQEIAQGADMTAYVITAHSVNKPPLPDVVHEVTGTSKNSQSVKFKAAEVAGGKWKWTVTPRFHAWVGQESDRSDPLDFSGVPATVAPGEAALVVAVPDPATTPATVASVKPAETADVKPPTTVASLPTKEATTAPPPVVKEEEPPSAEIEPSPPDVQETPASPGTAPQTP
ncbi:hypothetical protein [Actinoplanes sp. NPDC089786]|uniref:hypothetical protein n=1 Tax=Actinoplanes sp. NPDC089786 TaxID=3155185 RepID=UPI0034417E2B